MLKTRDTALLYSQETIPLKNKLHKLCIFHRSSRKKSLKSSFEIYRSSKLISNVTISIQHFCESISLDAAVFHRDSSFFHPCSFSNVPRRRSDAFFVTFTVQGATFRSAKRTRNTGCQNGNARSPGTPTRTRENDIEFEIQFERIEFSINT